MSIHMIPMLKKEAAMTITATPVLPQTTTTTWNIDPAHTAAEFKVKHMMIANVKGHFSRVSGVLIGMNLTRQTIASRPPSKPPPFTPAMNSAMLT